MNEVKTPTLLEVENINKSFYGNLVLDDISFQLEQGKVLGLIGQNGAGKSTLVKILTGAYEKDSGSVFINGDEAEFSTIKEANNSGVAMVFQELSLALNMSVADNIFVHNWPTNRAEIVNQNELYQETKKLIENFDIDIDPNEKVENLNNGERQIVEILKAVSKDPNLLILDEPSSSLEHEEIDILFKFIRTLQEDGYSIIYISHHMNEIFDICDDLLVLRDGKKVLHCPKEDTNVEDVVDVMVGHAQEDKAFNLTEKSVSDEVLLEVKKLNKNSEYKNIDFDLKKGEILGIAGIVGSGKQEICETLFGIRQPNQGEIIINNKSLEIDNPATAKSNGIVAIPEDRKDEGLFLDNDVRNNMIASILNDVSNGLFLSDNKIDDVVNEYSTATKVKMVNDKEEVRFLSGGNQQKVLVSKNLAAKPKVLIAMDPTRGIDVTAKADIHEILYELSLEGLSIILISSEVDELITISDRILVMNSGNVTKEYKQNEFNENDITVSMHKSIDEVE